MIKDRLYNICIPYNNMTMPKRVITKARFGYAVKYVDGWPCERHNYKTWVLIKPLAYIWLLYKFTKCSAYGNKRIYPRKTHYWNRGYK